MGKKTEKRGRSESPPDDNPERLTKVRLRRKAYIPPEQDEIVFHDDAPPVEEGEEDEFFFRTLSPSVYGDFKPDDNHPLWGGWVRGMRRHYHRETREDQDEIMLIKVARFMSRGGSHSIPEQRGSLWDDWDGDLNDDTPEELLKKGQYGWSFPNSSFSRQRAWLKLDAQRREQREQAKAQGTTLPRWGTYQQTKDTSYPSANVVVNPNIDVLKLPVSRRRFSVFRDQVMSVLGTSDEVPWYKFVGEEAKEYITGLLSTGDGTYSVLEWDRWFSWPIDHLRDQLVPLLPAEDGVPILTTSAGLKAALIKVKPTFDVNKPDSVQNYIHALRTLFANAGKSRTPDTHMSSSELATVLKEVMKEWVKGSDDSASSRILVLRELKTQLENPYPPLLRKTMEMAKHLHWQDWLSGLEMKRQQMQGFFGYFKEIPDTFRIGFGGKDPFHEWEWVGVTFESWSTRLQQEFKQIDTLYKESGRLGFHLGTSQNAAKGSTQSGSTSNSGSSKPKVDTVRPQLKTTSAGSRSCYTCGRFDHKSDKCALKDHPDANRDKTEWESSTAGKKYAALNKDRLPWNKRLNDEGELVDWADAPPPIGKPKHAAGSSSDTKVLT